MKGLQVLFTILMCMLCSLQLSATHIRASDISAQRTGFLSYRIELVVYTDRATTLDGNPNGIAMGSVNIQVLGAEITVPRSSVELLQNDTYKHVYYHNVTFPSPNNTYTVSYTDNNRIGGIANIGGQTSSENVPLYVEVKIVTDSFIENSTPYMTIAPVDYAAVNRVFTHNPGARDDDGDSLTYRLVPPLEGNGMVVPSYVYPDNASFGAGSVMTLNPLTGDLVWNTPKQAGIYNIAIEITEWRVTPFGVLLMSITMRDMQIIVRNTNNNPPILEIPQDTCIAVGTYIGEVYAYDPERDPIRLTVFGTPVDNGGGLTNLMIRNDTTYADFRWNALCSDVRASSYSVTFKAEDIRTISLATLKTMQITVVAPAPDIINVAQSGDNALVTWSAYQCDLEASGIAIYRVECDTSLIERSSCVTGVPDEWGFTKIATVSANETSYLDNNVKQGIAYCYVLVAEFPQPRGGESYASEVECITIEVTKPIITKADVQITDEVNGEVVLNWKSPANFDPLVFPGPYRMEVYREIGIEGGVPTNLIFTTTLNDFTEVSYTDTGLDTRNNAYRYVVRVFYDNNQLYETSEIASTVFLTGESLGQRVVLSWTQNVVWNFPDTLNYLVYMQIDDQSFEILDSLPQRSMTYTATELLDGEEYCFYVETRGVFCDLNENDKVIINRSNEVCVIPEDNSPPCPPVLAIEPIDCDVFEFTDTYTNKLTWQNFISSVCEDDIISYDIFYTNTYKENYQLLTTTTDTSNLSYLHEGLLSKAGCYYITATDAGGNVSDTSNHVCIDNCVFFQLPNIFTPNDDLKNDFLIPMPIPRFVERVQFAVYNRWGKIVYTSDSPTVRWDGKTMKGDPAVEGVYFYNAEVEFLKLIPDERVENIKGWILLQR